MNWYSMIKTAGFQKGWQDTMGDMQRHVLDAYSTNVYLTKTEKKITVSATVVHNQFGLIVFQDFWKFSLDEQAAANSTFSAVKTAVKKIFDEFESNETPNNLLWTTIREALRGVDVEHKPSTRIPWIDQRRRHEGVADWRSSLYGTRYPENDGF